MYFAALLARTEDGWEASDTELDDVETLSDLADLARESSVEDDTVLVLIEQEDAWFSVVRVDGEDDPRVYVSDAAVAARSSYGEVLLADLLAKDSDDDLDALDLDGTEDGEEDDDDDSAAEAVPHGPLGDARLLDDLGISEKQLKAFDADALTEIADALGATEILEAVR
ncbi:tRNA adenosine deaminase-associated protein [Streptomyces sp. S6]